MTQEAGRSAGARGSPEHALRWVPIALLSARGDQPRQSMDHVALERLTESIRERGVLQPIRVRRRGQSYEIIAGERRWMAARQAGLDAIPAVVVDADDDQAFIEALIENIQREDLNPVDRGHALSRLRVDLGLQSWEEVGRYVGITRQHVYNLLGVAHLPAPIREDVRMGRLTEKHGRALLRLRGHPSEQRELWERIHAEGLSGDGALSASRALRPRRRGSQGASGARRLRAAIGELQRLVAEAAPDEIQAASLDLADLRRRLGDILDPGDAGHEGPGPSPAS